MGASLHAHEGLISNFLLSLETAGQGATTVEAAVAWAVLPTGASLRWRAYRLAVVRGFAAYVHAQNPALALNVEDVDPTAGVITVNGK